MRVQVDGGGEMMSSGDAFLGAVVDCFVVPPRSDVMGA